MGCLEPQGIRWDGVRQPDVLAEVLGSRGCGEHRCRHPEGGPGDASPSHMPQVDGARNKNQKASWTFKVHMAHVPCMLGLKPFTIGTFEVQIAAIDDDKPLMLGKIQDIKGILTCFLWFAPFLIEPAKEETQNTPGKFGVV